MKYFSCIKQVPDLSVPMRVQNGELVQDTERMMLNAYDASAVEESLVMTEKHGGELEVVLIGPEKAKETLRKAMAMGAGKGNHIAMEDLSGMDSEAYSEILAAFFKNVEFDVITCGKQAQDTDAGLTGSMLAEKLGLPYATNAVGLDADEENKKVIVTRQGDSGQEVIELPAPCLITCSNDMNEPRIPSLKGIMQSKKKPVDNLSLDQLGLDEQQLKSGKVTTVVTGYENVPERQPGPKLEGDPEETVSKLVDLLENEAKVL